MTKCLLTRGVCLWEVSVSGGSTVGHILLLGSLSNNDGDGNENATKQ